MCDTPTKGQCNLHRICRKESRRSQTEQTNPERKKSHATPSLPPRGPGLTSSLSWTCTYACCMSLTFMPPQLLVCLDVECRFINFDQGELHCPISLASTKSILDPHLLPNIGRPSGWSEVHQQQAQSESFAVAQCACKSSCCRNTTQGKMCTMLQLHPRIWIALRAQDYGELAVSMPQFFKACYALSDKTLVD
jgi:hypothetical protein